VEFQTRTPPRFRQKGTASLRSPASSTGRATRSTVVQPNLLQEIRNFGRFCGMGGPLSILLRPAFSVEGQVGMSTSICSSGWGTGRSSAATSPPTRTSASSIEHGGIWRLPGRRQRMCRGHRYGSRVDLTNTLDTDHHVAIFGNLCITASMTGRQGTATTRVPPFRRPAPWPAAHDARGLQLHPSTRTSTRSTSTARRLFACDGLRNVGCRDSTLSSVSTSDRGT